MRVWLSLALVACLAGACSTPREPDRLVFGVSEDRDAGASSAEADAELRRRLDRTLNQICTPGYQTVKVDTLGAEANKQIVDELARCNDYRLSFLPDLF
jgi:hypothetical protein